MADPRTQQLIDQETSQLQSEAKAQRQQRREELMRKARDAAKGKRVASDGPKVVLEVGDLLNSYCLFFH